MNPRVSNTSNGETMLLSKCGKCGSKKSWFIKNQEAKGLLSNLGFRIPLSKVPLLRDILFELYRMNEIVNRFLLAGNKCMLEMHLKQPGFIYSVCRPFTKNKEIIQKFKKIEDTKYIYRNERDKTYFQHDMAYGDFKNLAKRTACDKLLRDKAFNIAKNPKYNGNQRGLASMVYKFFDKKPASGSGVADNEMKQNLQLAEVLHKTIIKNFKKRTVYSGVKDNTWGADLADIQLISKFNTGFRFVLCVINIFSKYAWVVPLKDKKGVTIVSTFQKILDESKRKPKKVWVDKAVNFTIVLLKNAKR